MGSHIPYPSCLIPSTPCTRDGVAQIVCRKGVYYSYHIQHVVPVAGCSISCLIPQNPPAHHVITWGAMVLGYYIIIFIYSISHSVLQRMWDVSQHDQIASYLDRDAGDVSYIIPSLLPSQRVYQREHIITHIISTLLHQVVHQRACSALATSSTYHHSMWVLQQLHHLCYHYIRCRGCSDVSQYVRQIGQLDGQHVAWDTSCASDQVDG